MYKIGEMVLSRSFVLGAHVGEKSRDSTTYIPNERPAPASVPIPDLGNDAMEAKGS